MSEFKGTRGKWELSEVNGELITTEDTNVCKIFAMELKEGQSNAKLIACAPEMLEMLIKLNNFCTMKVEDRNELEGLIKKATE